MITPRDFGHQLKLQPESDDHRTLVAWHVPAWFLVGVVGAVSLFLAFRGLADLKKHPERVIAVAGVLGCLTLTATLTLIAATSSIVGIVFHYTDRRNLMPASSQVAAYLSTYLLIWAAVAHGMTIVLVATERVVDQLARLIGMNPETLVVLAWGAPNLVFLVVFCGLVARGTAGARYANR